MAFRGEDPKIKSSLTITKSNSAGDVPIVVENTSNTASSTASITTSVAGASADNPFYVATVTGAQSWSWGIDNSDSDSFKISHAANLDSNTAVTIDTSKNMTVGNDLTVTGTINPSSFIANRTYAVSSADYTILDTDGYDTILVTTGASNRTITLPTATDNTNRQIVVKKVDSGVGTVIIDGEGSETIDGATTQTLYSQYGRATLVCDGTSWHLLDYQAGSSKAFSTTSMTFQNDTGITIITPTLTEQIIGDALHVTFAFRTSGTGTDASDFIIDLIQYPNLPLTTGTFGQGGLGYGTSATEALNLVVIVESDGELKLKNTAVDVANIKGDDFSSSGITYVNGTAIIPLG